MGDIRWTPAQQEVIETRGKNILVSAAAGSGKTAVLAERVVEKCTDPVHPVDCDRILVLTFTRAAAREMKERIYKSLAALQKENPSDRNLRRQLTLIHNARISTIDSFCAYVYRNYFEDIGLDPNLSLMTEEEGRALADKVLSDLFERRFEEGDPDIYLLSDYFSARDKSSDLSDAVKEVAASLSAAPWPDKALSALLAPYQAKSVEEMEASPDMVFLVRLLREQFKDAVASYDDLIDMLFEDDDIYRDFFAEEQAAYRRVSEQETFTSLVTAYADMKAAALRLPSRGRQKQEYDDEVKEFRKKIRGAVDGAMKPYLSLELPAVFSDMKSAEGYARALVALAGDFYHTFLSEKIGQGLMDFSDCEHMALSILVDEETGKRRSAAEELSAYFEEIMVDEYQDSNALQEAILQSLVTQTEDYGNYFMVGDVKQSIYRFRSADPAIFEGKYRTFTEGDGRDRLIQLDQNFRSRQAVISSVNAIFENIMGADLGGVSYGAAEALKPGASFPEDTEANRTEVLLVQKGEEENALSAEAAAVCREIRRIMEEVPVRDKESGELRRAVYGDFAILTSSTKATYSVLEKACDEAGIPFVMVEKENYLLSYEVEIMCSLLALVDNPRDDISLAAVLKSPLFGASDDLLLRIRTERPEGYFFTAVRAYEAAHPEEAVLKAFSTLLSDLRERAAYTPIHELISSIYDRTGFLNYMTAMPGGALRRENLLRLFDLAVSYEQKQMKGLFGFLRYVERQKKYTSEAESSDFLAGSADAVSFMTIHKSKGLQFPFVILYGAGKKLQGVRYENNFFLDRDHGLYLSAFDADRRTRRRYLLSYAATKREEGEIRGESIRLLYVALTRAEEKLLITGTVEEPETVLEEAKGTRLPLSYAKKAGASSFLDYILPVAVKRPDLFLVRRAEEETEGPAGGETAKRAEKKAARLVRLKAESASEKAVAAAEDLTRQMTFTYAHADEVVYKTKYTVSEIKDQEMGRVLADGQSLFPEDTDREPTIPAFLGGKEKKVRGSDVGSAMHRFLECYDFGRTDFSSAVEAEKERMLQSRLLCEEEASLLALSALSAFMQEDIARRLHEAAERSELYREKAFVMEKKAADIFPEGTDEKILVQGIIDVFFFEGNDIILLDYKTDKVRNAAVLKERYRKQLDLYGEALERAYGRSCREKCIYSLTMGQMIAL